MKKVYIALFFAFLSSAVQLNAETKYPSDQYCGRRYVSKGDTLRYRILYPQGYDADGLKFPLFIFLHGEDEKGTDNVLQLKYGGFLFKSKENRDFYPAVVIIPQCPEEDAWANYNVLDDGTVELPDNPEETSAMKVLARLVEHYLNKPYVDKSRVYIVGMSEGAFGALDMVVRYPKMFSAAVSMGGAIDPERLKKLKKFPIRLYHGADDKMVPVDYARNDFYQLKSTGSSSLLSEYPGVGHDCWTTALSASDFLEWIFNQKKK